ncbi:MAG: EF-hand domain-containing protein [Planctomycetota bacterium]|jgi:Ca2+-binding EF-hand superfamily protein|nr:EF-hand domain-containing protein [Planctomycetota bacterium]
MQINASSLTTGFSSLAVQNRQRKTPSEGELFAKADSNGDGKVDAAEIAAMLAQIQSSQPSDGQNDGEQAPTFSKEEIATLFADADSDGDGYLSLDDFTAFGEKMRGNAQPPAGAPPGPPPAGEPPSPMSEDEVAALFTEADSDEDGLLSLEEFIALREKMAANGQSSAASGSTAADGAADLDVLSQLAQTSIGGLRDVLFGDSRTSSSPLSLAELLNNANRTDSDLETGGDFISLIQNLLEKAYQLGQRDASAGTATVSEIQ